MNELDISTNCVKKQRLDTLQVVRAFAFLGIFTSHSRLNSMLGAWGVCMFFVMSGFLMSYNYFDREIKFDLFSSIKFSWGKIKKLYLLHFIMTLVAVPYQLYTTENLRNIKTIGVLAIKFILNLTLLQTWMPYMTWFASYNGVSWFLSSLMFCYFMFPVLFSFIKKIQKNAMLIILIISIYSIQTIFAYCTRSISFDAGEFWGNYYLAYTAPFFRLGDFSIGCCLGLLFLYNKDKLTAKKSTIMEVVAILLIILSSVIYKYQIGIIGGKWFSLSLLWIPSSLLLLYTCGGGYGILSNFLRKKLLVEFGNKTNKYFLIHGMVITYMLLIVSHFVNNHNNIFFYIVMAEVNLIITIVGCTIFEKIEAKINVRKNKRNIIWRQN